MSKRNDDIFGLYKDACAIACRFVRDAGYEHVEFSNGVDTRRQEGKESVFYIHIQARKGPNATRKTPIEFLTVRVRITGLARKTLRPSFFEPPEGGR